MLGKNFSLIYCSKLGELLNEMIGWLVDRVDYQDLKIFSWTLLSRVLAVQLTKYIFNLRVLL